MGFAAVEITLIGFHDGVVVEITLIGFHDGVVVEITMGLATTYCGFHNKFCG